MILFGLRTLRICFWCVASIQSSFDDIFLFGHALITSACGKRFIHGSVAFSDQQLCMTEGVETKHVSFLPTTRVGKDGKQ
eukprot:6322760-Amphidinium_carterae.2